MNCAHCGAPLNATTGWTQVGDSDPAFPAGTIVCMSRSCLPNIQRPAPSVDRPPAPR